MLEENVYMKNTQLSRVHVIQSSHRVRNIRKTKKKKYLHFKAINYFALESSNFKINHIYKWKEYKFMRTL